MDEDVDPKHAAKSDGKGKNPFEKKAAVFHMFLGTPHLPTTENLYEDTDGHSTPCSPIPALVRYSNYLGQEGSPRPHPYGEPVCHGHQPPD